jgi:alpha-L-fucosidase
MRYELFLIATVALLACNNDHSLGVLDPAGATRDGGAVDVAADSPSTILGCPGLAGSPSGVAPLPTPAQVAYQRTELTASIHFGLNTFDGTEEGDPSKDSPSLFNPTNLDASQWVRALKAAGFQQAMLVVKHYTGFCLWPSAYTEYSVKTSPWKNGQGDVVREFVDAMHAEEMRVAFYISPRDDHYPSSSATYGDYFKNLLTELLTNYGAVHEIAWPGYQTSNPLDWKEIAQLAHRLQPDILVWMAPEIATTGADVRYSGNQYGQGSRSTSAIGNVPNGGPSNVWYPTEGQLSDRNPWTWFWHPNNSVISLGDLQSAYFNTVGMNTTLILNVPPATTGQHDTPDLDLLRQFGTWHSSLYNTNLVQGQPVAADSTWASPGFDAAMAVDGNLCTYWAAQEARSSARLEVTPTAAVKVGVISIREPIELGERTTAYHIEIKQNGIWNRSPTDASGATIAGTVIGQRQLWRLGSTTADAIALVIDAAKAAPAIAELAVY